MATMFKRLKHYCHLNKRELPTIKERMDLGKQVVAAWYSQEKIVIKYLAKVKTQEPEGEFTALSYPSYFNNVIDRIIESYYKIHSPPPKKERKRTPIKRVPENKKRFCPKPK